MTDGNNGLTPNEELKMLLDLKCGPQVFCNWHLLVAQVFFGVFYHELILRAIPWESSIVNYAVYVIPLGAAFGTYMVSNVGRQKSPLHLSLIGAYIGEWIAVGNPILVAVFSTLVSTCGWKWRKEKEEVSWGKCLMGVFLVYGVFLFLCLSYINFNASIETPDGETIKIRDALESVFHLWKAGGFEALWKLVVDVTGLNAEGEAYNVLGLEPGTAFKEVRKRYKMFARKWHPDHYHEQEMKQKAKDEFIRYKNAYEVLKEIQKFN